MFQNPRNTLILSPKQSTLSNLGMLFAYILVFFILPKRFQQTFANLPSFNCEARCQAPDVFFSGAPWVSHPENGTLKIKLKDEIHIEWQIWKGLKNSTINSNKVILILKKQVFNF